MHTFDLVNFPVHETIRLLAGFLDCLTSANNVLVTRTFDPILKSPVCPAYTSFHARTIPTIEIHSYLSRILRYCPCPNECFISLLVYFDRMAKASTQKEPLAINSYNIHRLLITGIMVSTKFFSDIFYTNSRYGKVGGLPIQELNHLEMEFLAMNDFSLNVSVEELQLYANQLLRHSMKTTSTTSILNPPQALAYSQPSPIRKRALSRTSIEEADVEFATRTPPITPSPPDRPANERKLHRPVLPSINSITSSLPIRGGARWGRNMSRSLDSRPAFPVGSFGYRETSCNFLSDAIPSPQSDLEYWSGAMKSL
ncbi:cyclin-domain-containing protein [Basidiobolus meristosporus CBS 931.73]|uniref:Cyclin-domain-containing protein n=1 Tax=Basidiobolus meristosporus CBS 931.73 TaxID=1314790 RepID=A0A1Y1Y0N6_9FUNG|nr:cyclin-domain-containing protein [Basidiobolus meristosporus CBS 931.73]|eukprot:ORX91465.1 cyclin-domain-containing protein [Basidiobolus meristosporus CBS 931.73]